jgi:hypothetical protein
MKEWLLGLSNFFFIPHPLSLIPLLPGHLCAVKDIRMSWKKISAERVKRAGRRLAERSENYVY